MVEAEDGGAREEQGGLGVGRAGLDAGEEGRAGHAPQFLGQVPGWTEAHLLKLGAWIRRTSDLGVSSRAPFWTF